MLFWRSTWVLHAMLHRQAPDVCRSIGASGGPRARAVHSRAPSPRGCAARPRRGATKMRRRGSAPTSPGTRAAASAREIRRMAEPALDARLERFLATRLRDASAVRVTRLERSTEGFSQETFSFDVQIVRRDGTSEERGWVAKREPVAGLLEPYDLEPEFRVLHALSDDPLPSPPTPWFSKDPAVLERPFYVMERLPGEVPIPAPSLDGAGPFNEIERRTLGPRVAKALAQLHAVDWRSRGLAF